MGTTSLARLAEGWLLSLRAQRRSPATLDQYGTTTRMFVAWLEANQLPTTPTEITRREVEGWIVELLDTRSPSTAQTRYRGLRVFFGWLVDEGELERSPMERMKPPTVPEAPVPVLTAAQIKAVYGTCTGRTFEERRDQALLRFLASSGVRRSEAAGLTVADVDLERGTAVVHGKGSRTRVVAFDRDTAVALHRYLRARDAHTYAAKPALWLGEKGPLTGSGLAEMVSRRGTQAGVPGLHAHQLRHTWAHQQLSGGMTEGSLRALAGWRSRAMLDRYGASASAERAVAEYQRLDESRP